MFFLLGIMLVVVTYIIPEGCAFGLFYFFNLHHYTGSAMRTAEEEAWRRKTRDPVPVSLLSGDRKPQDKVDAKAELDEIRNSMKMKHSQNNCLKFV